jgi:hypothetical protein
MKIEPSSAASEISHWCELILATETIFVNNRLEEVFSYGKTVIPYCTTAAGPAHVQSSPQSLLSNIQTDESSY